MSKYDETFDSTEMECPYCGSKHQPEAEDWDEDESVEGCEDCGNSYHVHQSFDVTHHARPDCEINGKAHKYEPHQFDDGHVSWFCSECGDCQIHDPGQQGTRNDN